MTDTAAVQQHMHATWSALFSHDFATAVAQDACVKALCHAMGGLPSTFRDPTTTGIEGPARSFLIGAVYDKDVAMASFLLDQGADSNDVYRDSDFQGSAMFELVRSQPLDKDMLRLFVTKGRADLDAPSGDEQGGDCTIRGEILRSPDHHFRDIVHVLTECGITLSLPPPRAHAPE